MNTQRKQYGTVEKVAIPRRHLLDKKPISKLCDDLGSQPTVFHRWQNEFVENGRLSSIGPLQSSESETRLRYN